MSQTYPPQLAGFISGSPPHRKAIARRVAAFAEELPPGSVVLDAGAGNAPYAPLFDHCVYRTQDWSQSVHAGARSVDVVGDLHDLPVDAETFDAIVCTEVLEHVVDPRRVLAELQRILRLEGRLLLTVPFVMELHEEPYDYFRYTSHALRELLSGAGFEIEHVDPLTGWWSTLAHVLAHAAPSMRAVDRPAGVRARAMGWAMRQASRPVAQLAPLLDRVDERRALPLGWACLARRTSAERAAATLLDP